MPVVTSTADKVRLFNSIDVMESSMLPVAGGRREPFVEADFCSRRRPTTAAPAATRAR
jgi:hypothetical protein